jgi:hypothetical protein
MAEVTMKQLLEAGVHFGHQTSRWNPKMKPYIFGARNGIYIIDLQQTVKLLQDAYNFIRDLSANGGSLLMVGTKKQAQDAIQEEAERCACTMSTTAAGRHADQLPDHQAERRSPAQARGNARGHEDRRLPSRSASCSS